jgi:predicted DNA-binding transcriptional regulator AlpA
VVEHVSIRVLPDGRVSRADAAAFLGRSPKTLADWFSKGTGPKPRKVGSRVFYLLKDLEAFRDSGAREAA